VQSRQLYQTNSRKGNRVMSYDLSDIQIEYGNSCVRYEKLVERQLRNSDTIIISGYGCSLSVKNDALVIFPGKTHNAQKQDTVTLYRGQKSVRRILMLNDKGTVSLSAVKWASEQDISIMAIDGLGDLLLSLPPESDPDAKLRHAQYRACDTGRDVAISRELVRRKTELQVEMLNAMPSHPITNGRHLIMNGRNVKIVAKGKFEDGAFIWEPLEQMLTELDVCHDMNSIRFLEARIANSYWDNFVGLPIYWRARDKKRIPPHWQRCTGRLSSLSGNRTAQHATNPYQAVMNYDYALLQGQCKQALLSQGFDVSCGFLHTDQLGRDSLVFDLMEVHRPQVDHLVLDFFAKNVLAKGDFMSTNDGSVKFNPQFSRYIAASCRIDQKDIDDSAVWLKSCLI
jgi:CRISP-associated protein Cas1